MKINVGIDLGTTYSAVATFDKASGSVRVLKNSLGSDTTPSVLCLEGGRTLIGAEAKDEQKSGNVNTVAFYKSMMGDPDWNAYIDDTEYSAEQLSGIFLRELVRDVAENNNVEIDSAVITVPAYFNDRQREATIRAGRAAGLKVLKIINEPTSAIIAYGLTGGKKKNVLVYDLGGGTFDVTVARVDGTAISVLATNGNHQLGGKDWDDVLLNDIKDRFMSENGISIDDHPEDLKELQVKCEEAKKRLSSVSSTQIAIQCEGILGKYTVTREEFDDSTYSLLYQTILLINSCFDEISASENRKFGWNDIDEVVLVGGSTRMPQVRDMVIKEYGRPPVTKDINVDTIVATGAAMQAELCVSSTLTLKIAPTTPQAGGARTPMSLTIRNSDIQDITAHSLGMLAMSSDGSTFINSIIIQKNSKVNETFSRSYTFDNDRMQVYVLQGESRDPFETEILGAYVITGMKKGVKNNLKVNFLYNSNGVVEVNACLDNGTALSAVREQVTESMDQIIARLKREKEEAEEAARQASKVEIMIVIDTSGSMCGNPIREAQRAAREFVKSFDMSRTIISIVSFANTASYIQQWTSDPSNIEQAICKFPSWNEDGGGTSAAPIAKFGDKFSGIYPRVMIILTDGYWTQQASEIKAAERVKADGVIIYGIGIGEADEKFLSQISSGKGRKVDLSELTKTFKEVASSIATEVVGSSLKK